MNIITAPHNEWTITPKKMLDYLAYMNRAGLVEATTTDWRDLFFENIHDQTGG